MSENKVNRLIVFRNGAVHATFIDGHEGSLDTAVGDLSTDGLLWYEHGKDGPVLMNCNDPRLKTLEGLVPEDTNRGWLLAKTFNESATVQVSQVRPVRIRLVRYGERSPWTAVATLASGREIEIGHVPEGLGVRRGSAYEDDVLEIRPEWLAEEEP